MRTREEIQKDGRLKNDLILEVLLDIRECLAPKPVVKGEFECDVCGKSFAHKIALAGHKRSHK